MCKKLNRRSAVGTQIVAVWFAALFACALASDALAGRPAADPDAGERALPAHIANVVERISPGEPTLTRNLAPGRTIVLAQRCFIYYGHLRCF